jgi:terminase small subunit / prophage DNA-packing protein
MTGDALNLDQLAELFAVTPTTVRRWVKDGLPILEKGRPGRGSHPTRISLRAAVAWYFSENAEHLEADRQRARKDKETADKLALQNAETRSDVARVSVMERELAALLADMRSRALGVGARLSPHLVGLTTNEICTRIDLAMTTLLREIVDYRPGAKNIEYQ